jgi:hypothetical protein
VEDAGVAAGTAEAAESVIGEYAGVSEGVAGSVMRMSVPQR